MFKRLCVIGVLTILSSSIVYALGDGDIKPKAEPNKYLQQIAKNNDEYVNDVAKLFSKKEEKPIIKINKESESDKKSGAKLNAIFEEGARIYLKNKEEQDRKTNSRYSVSPDSDLSNKNAYITADDMNKIIAHFESFNGGSPFHNQGEIFIQASEESGLDPIYILAHASWESDWGRSFLARDRGNYFGINAIDANPDAAHNMGSTMASGIINGASWISKNYYQEGQTTLHSMIYGKKKYAQAADKWINGVNSIMNESYAVLKRSRNL